MVNTILVIDDEEAVRKSFALALEDTGCRVETAESGSKGIEEVRSAKYDLIFLDLKMPGMNGVETLMEIRKIDREVPVYIVTAFHKEFFDQLRVAEEEGVRFELLRKPLSSDQIVLITKSILDSPQTIRRRRSAMYEFRLYIVGQTLNSISVINRFKAFLDERFKDQYSFTVIDILQDPKQAESDKILATPTLLKVLPLPVKKIIGDLSDEKKLLEVLLS